MSVTKSKAVKEPDTKHDIHPLLKKRWSARSFSDRAIPEKQMMELFEAASWAPSSRNEQPWIYIYAHQDDREQFDKFLNCLLEGNRKWAKDAAVLVVSLTQKYFLRNSSENFHAMHDVGASNLQLILQAVHKDIYGHMMAGFDKEKTIKTFEIPDHLEPCCFIALGYLDEPEKLEEPFRGREVEPRTRHDLDKFVFKNELK